MLNIAEALLWLTVTVYFEAGKEPRQGQINVAKVILNRADANSWPVRNIVLARKQFSCYNEGLSGPLMIIKSLPALFRIHDRMQDAIAEWDAGSRLQGATHFYAPLGMPGGKPPYWIVDMEFITAIGGHRFYKEKKRGG